MSEGIRRRSLPGPGPLDEAEAGLEARIRDKLERGAPLDPDEKAFLARLPAHHEIPPGEVQQAAAAHGGVEPIDAATGRPHVAQPPMGGRDRNLRPLRDEDLDAP